MTLYNAVEWKNTRARKRIIFMKQRKGLYILQGCDSGLLRRLIILFYFFMYD